MSAEVEYLLNRASEAEIAEHLLRCNADFVPPLSARVEISDYARKIAGQAMRFEAWSNGTLVGLVAAYCNDREIGVAYITSVSMLREWMSKGVAASLIGLCMEYSKASGMRQISLEVAVGNMSAIKLYENCGFSASKANGPFITMEQHLDVGGEHGQKA